MNRKDFKSDIEYYFALYLTELKAAGYVDEWVYEKYTWSLSDPIKSEYTHISKRGKISAKTEHLAHKASITADFSVKWSEKAKNVFYLDVNEPIEGRVKDIPFRVDDPDVRISHIETKGSSESRTSSSISFMYKFKWCYQLYNIFIQKIKPYHPTKGLLFGDTFTPVEVVKLERYKRDSKWGRKGQSKIKYKIKTLKEYVQDKT